MHAVPVAVAPTVGDPADDGGSGRGRPRSSLGATIPSSGLRVPADQIGRRRRGGGRGELAAALGEAALELVRVLVAAQRLRAVELAPAVGAREGPVVAGVPRCHKRRYGPVPHRSRRCRVDEPQVQVHVAGRRPRTLHFLAAIGRSIGELAS